MLLYTRFPTDSTRKFLEQMNAHKVAGYKIILQKQVAFLDTNNECAREKSGKQSHYCSLKITLE